MQKGNFSSDVSEPTGCVLSNFGDVVDVCMDALKMRAASSGSASSSSSSSSLSVSEHVSDAAEASDVHVGGETGAFWIRQLEETICFEFFILSTPADFIMQLHE